MDSSPTVIPSCDRSSLRPGVDWLRSSPSVRTPARPAPDRSDTGICISFCAAQMLVMLEQEDVDQRGRAEQTAAMIQMEAKKLGATATVEVLSAAYDPLAPHLMQMARVSDICIMMAPSCPDPQQRDIVLDMLLGSCSPIARADALEGAGPCAKSRRCVGRQRVRGAGRAGRASATRPHRFGGSVVGPG